jgi:hypothetical protein
MGGATTSHVSHPSHGWQIVRAHGHLGALHGRAKVSLEDHFMKPHSCHLQILSGDRASWICLETTAWVMSCGHNTH